MKYEEKTHLCSTASPTKGILLTKKKAPTESHRNEIINEKLKNDHRYYLVAVPPERISIKDESGVDRTSVVGPYSEGEIVNLYCDVFGGM